MHEEIMVSIYTQVYNNRDYIDKCVQSILNQTYKNFEYILIDNGCTDGSKEILEQYAQKDNRIRLIRYEKNTPLALWVYIAQKSAKGKYIANLDSDDWIELDYLEKLINLCEKNDLDMICTGSLFHHEGEGPLVTEIPRVANQQIIMDREKMLAYLRYYYTFFVTTWGKLFRRDIFCETDFSIIEKNKFSYGGDTIIVFTFLSNAKKVCVDNSVLHHYLLREKSASYVYDPRRYLFATYLYQILVDFFSDEGKINVDNLNFSAGVFALNINLTAHDVYHSELSSKEKIKKLLDIANLPVVNELFKLGYPDIAKLKNTIAYFIHQLKSEKSPDKLPQKR